MSLRICVSSDKSNMDISCMMARAIGPCISVMVWASWYAIVGMMLALPGMVDDSKVEGIVCFEKNNDAANCPRSFILSEIVCASSEAVGLSNSPWAHMIGACAWERS